MNFLLKHLFLLIIIQFLFSCSKDENINPIINEYSEGYQYTIPEQNDDGWPTASVEEVGMSKEPLIEMVNMLDSSQNHQIHNVLIFKENKLVFEKYFKALKYFDSPPSNGTEIITYSRDKLHYLASGSKSVTSVLFGIAIKEGFIDGNVDSKVQKYFPQYNTVFRGPKKNMTIKHLLTMTSGLDFDENTYPYDDKRNDVTALFYESDPIKFVLNKSMHANPGQVFHYNSGVTNVIGEIIRIQSEKNLLDFAKLYLFDPLGITQYNWQRISGQYYFASGGLSLRPRDMAKIGYLLLNEGIWEGKQIITPEWISESTKSYIAPDINLTGGYGYQWWVETVEVGGTPVNYCLSAGFGEQYMFVVPALDLIMIFNGGYFDISITISPQQLINDYIVYALFPDM